VTEHNRHEHDQPATEREGFFDKVKDFFTGDDEPAGERTPAEGDVETEVERAARGEEITPTAESDPGPVETEGGNTAATTIDRADADREDDDAGSDVDNTGSDAVEESDEDRRRREEEFAQEHDPAQHDVAAGEELRQRGDWTAEDGHIGEGQVDSGMPGGGSTETNLRESTIEEVRDGGHGVGSAAPIAGGVMPFGHPVKAWHDSNTYVLPGQPGYDAEPHEWFIDAGAAERAGFRPAHDG